MHPARLVIECGRCRDDEYAALVAALDAEFITGRERCVSLAARFPHALNPAALAQLQVARIDGAIAACMVARQFALPVLEEYPGAHPVSSPPHPSPLPQGEREQRAAVRIGGSKLFHLPLRERVRVRGKESVASPSEAAADGTTVRAAMIGMVYTAPHARGQGLATRLLAATTQALQSEGVDVAVLWSGLQGYYETRGWLKYDCGMLGTVSASRTRSRIAAAELTAPTDPRVASLYATHQREGIARSGAAWSAVPLPADTTHCFITANAYALYGRERERVFLYEMLGDAQEFSQLWSALAATAPTIYINACRDSAAYQWLSSETAVTWCTQDLAFWRALTSRVSAADFAQMYVPYFDRI